MKNFLCVLVGMVLATGYFFTRDTLDALHSAEQRIQRIERFLQQATAQQ